MSREIRTSSWEDGQGRRVPAAEWFTLAVEARAGRKSVRAFLNVLREAVALVWTASPRLLIRTGLLQLAGAVLVVAQLALVQVALDQLVRADRSAAADSAVVVAVALLALVTAMGGITTVVLTLWQRLLGDLAVREVWRGILEVTGTVDLTSFERAAFYDHLERVKVNAVARPMMVVRGVLGLAGGFVGALGVAGALFIVQPLLLPALLLAGIPLWITSRRAGQLEFDFVVSQTPSLRRRTYLSKVLTGRDEAKEVRAFGLREPLRRDFEKEYESYFAALRQHIRLRQRLAAVGTLGATALTGLTVALLLWLLVADEISLGQAGTALVAIRLLSTRVGMLLEGVGQLFESGLFLRDYSDFVSFGTASMAVAPPRPAPAPFARLTLEDAAFRYPGADSDALEGVNLTLERGQVVAIVGENGSGKTTLAKLLAGLYTPTAGRVCWDDVDVQELDPAARADHVAVVFQDFIRYQLTAERNISLGRHEVTGDAERVAAAASRAGALEFIERLPAEFDTLLTKEYADGVDLSQGQWQRVALARAFYRDAPFVILDEPSASLDARAEHRLFEDLRQLLAGRTVVLISHRFSTVRSADVILVMDRGRVVEQGRHDELLAARGIYAELFNLQAASYLPPTMEVSP